jgi:hypothetical protein
MRQCGVKISIEFSIKQWFVPIFRYSSLNSEAYDCQQSPAEAIPREKAEAGPERNAQTGVQEGS